MRNPAYFARSERLGLGLFIVHGTTPVFLAGLFFRDGACFRAGRLSPLYWFAKIPSLPAGILSEPIMAQFVVRWPLVTCKGI